MIEQQGQVVRLDGNRAWVRVGARSGCSACAAGTGCGAGLFGRLLRPHITEVRIDETTRTSVGQTVTLGLEERTYLAMVFLVYGLPLFAGLAGALLGHTIALREFDSGAWQGDLLTGSAALIFIYLTLRLSRQWVARQRGFGALKWLGATTRLDCPSSGLN